MLLLTTSTPSATAIQILINENKLEIRSSEEKETQFTSISYFNEGPITMNNHKQNLMGCLCYCLLLSKKVKLINHSTFAYHSYSTCDVFSLPLLITIVIMKRWLISITMAKHKTVRKKIFFSELNRIASLPGIFFSETNESFRNQLMCRENFSFLPTERTQIIAANDSMGN